MTSGPTTRRRQLGVALRGLRERKGLTLEAAGALVGISKATLSRYETKAGPVKWPAVDALCRMYDADDAEREALIGLAKEARTQGWWQSLADPLPETLNLMITLEDEAVREDHYACMYVPGLLQTPAYAEAIHKSSAMRRADDEIARLTKVRMKRQELLTRVRPPHIWVVLDEAVIRRVVGDVDIMREQLRHLSATASLPHVTVQLLPFSSGAHAAAVGSFLILGGEDQALDVVYVDLLGGGLFMERSAELDCYRLTFDYLRAQALDIDASAEYLERVSREL